MKGGKVGKKFLLKSVAMAAFGPIRISLHTAPEAEVGLILVSNQNLSRG